MLGKPEKLQGAFSNAQERGQIGSHKRGSIGEEQRRRSGASHTAVEYERELPIDPHGFQKRERDDDGEEDEEDSETYDEKLERWKDFFNDGALMRYWDKEEDDIIAKLLFNRLFEEVQTSATDANRMKHRGELQVRAFWDNVRASLRVDDDEIYDEWPYMEEPVDDPWKGMRRFRLGNKYGSRWWKTGSRFSLEKPTKHKEVVDDVNVLKAFVQGLRLDGGSVREN
ncbi:hypothetical protein B0J14DRAFT_647683 [Halenospora varia]|nr:hypothetical protein B0J14DRAFT_647683 [Halenospora varia]